MSSNNGWLFGQLRGMPGVVVEPGYTHLIRAEKDGHHYRIYTPTPDEYIISADLVQKARDLGANTLSFPSWCRAAREGILHGQDVGVDVMPHGRLLDILS